MVRKLDEEMAPEARNIHAGMQPGEVRSQDLVKAKVTTGDTTETVRVWRYSPFGIEFQNIASLGLKRGDTITLVVALGSDVNSYSGLVVNDLYRDGNVELVGVRTFRPSITEDQLADRRTTQRWVCADDYLPRGRAANPLAYNDFILFRLENISASGFRLITSMRNKLLGVGQRLDCTVSLPLVGSVQTTIVLKNIDTKVTKGKEELVIGAEFIRPDRVFKASLAEYLLNFADGVSIASLKRDLFPVKEYAQWFDFSYVKTSDEYNDVLALRYSAYKAANKLSPDKRVQDMADEFDARARILIVKHRGKTIGSLRAMFHSDSDLTDHGRYVSFPADFPKNAEMIECSRICTDPEFRGSDLFSELLAHLVLTAIKSGRRYVLGGAAGTLVPVYERYGFKKVGITYKNESLAGVEHQLILMDTHEVALGISVSMKAWIRVYSSVVDYLMDKEFIFPSGAQLIRINLWKAIGKIIGR